MTSPHESSLGREVAYPTRYDASLLFPIPRVGARAGLGIGRDAALPFAGHDRWHAYELGWLDARGRPQVATATVLVPATSPNLIESKSFKLYLNSLNAARFDDAAAVRVRIADDLSAAAGAQVEVHFGLPPVASAPEGESIDTADVDIDHYGPPDAAMLRAEPGDVVSEYLHSALLKSNCPVTGQPDWASLHLRYRGPRIDRGALLRYLCGFREHAGFHEQCVEQVFLDLQARCAPQWLSVEARYTRRGGLDINPWRATPGQDAPPALRDPRQ